MRDRDLHDNDLDMESVMWEVPRATTNLHEEEENLLLEFLVFFAVHVIPKATRLLTMH